MQASANSLLEMVSPQNKSKTKVGKASINDSGEFLSYIKEATPKDVVNKTISQPKSNDKQSQNPSIKNENLKESENTQSVSENPQNSKESEPDSKVDQSSTDKTTKSVDKTKIESDNAIKRLEENITKEGAATMLDDANLMQLLAVLDAINAPKDQQSGLFPKLGEKLATLLAVPENAVELSEVKSVADVIKLAKKFDLEIKDIKITNQIEQVLNDKFPNLAAKDFFKTSEQVVINSAEFLTKTKIDESLKQSKGDKNASLATLLGEVETNDEKPVNLIKPLKEKISKDEIKLESNKDDSVNIKSKTPTLKDLVFPEKVANVASKTSELNTANTMPNANIEPLSVADEPKGDINLNVAAKNIIAEAKIQLHNRTAVKETIGNFSSNLAEQVANYKAPITKVSMTLNPLNLGEVEVVMTTRGNNLHINFTSNTQAMNLFIANQAEFKNSLVNMGFTELSMNFSDQNQKQNQQGGQSPKGRSFFDNSEELDKEEQISLELILPRYI